MSSLLVSQVISWTATATTTSRYRPLTAVVSDGERERSVLLCVGETLWDRLPDGELRLGGAPTNVAVHAASLGVPTAVASRVGRDDLGREATRVLRERGVLTDLVSWDESLPTSVVTAVVDDVTGDVDYAFDTPCPWDFLEEPTSGGDEDDDEKDVVARADVVVVGTLIGRLGGASATTLRRLRETAGERLVLDVNLRPPWYDPSFVLELARGSDEHASPPLALIKVNEEELAVVEEWCGLDGTAALEERTRALARAVNARRACVTRAERGAVLYDDDDGAYREREGAPIVGDGGGDAVGAGDAFLAALVASLLLDGEDSDVALERGCALGAYVASRPGATPDHDDAPKGTRERFRRRNV